MSRQVDEQGEYTVPVVLKVRPYDVGGGSQFGWIASLRIGEKDVTVARSRASQTFPTSTRAMENAEETVAALVHQVIWHSDHRMP